MEQKTSSSEGVVSVSPSSLTWPPLPRSLSSYPNGDYGKVVSFRCALQAATSPAHLNLLALPTRKGVSCDPERPGGVLTI